MSASQGVYVHLLHEQSRAAEAVALTAGPTSNQQESNYAFVLFNRMAGNLLQTRAVSPYALQIYFPLRQQRRNPDFQLLNSLRLIEFMEIPVIVLIRNQPSFMVYKYLIPEIPYTNPAGFQRRLQIPGIIPCLPESKRLPALLLRPQPLPHMNRNAVQG